jgi:hypothetical protein
MADRVKISVFGCVLVGNFAPRRARHMERGRAPLNSVALQELLDASPEARLSRLIHPASNEDNHDDDASRGTVFDLSARTMRSSPASIRAASIMGTSSLSPMPGGRPRHSSASSNHQQHSSASLLPGEPVSRRIPLLASSPTFAEDMYALACPLSIGPLILCCASPPRIMVSARGRTDLILLDFDCAEISVVTTQATQILQCRRERSRWLVRDPPARPHLAAAAQGMV